MGNPVTWDYYCPKGCVIPGIRVKSFACPNCGIVNKPEDMPDHIDLKPYPMPDGAPNLMPFQDYPWNGDGYLAAEALRLKEKHGLTSAHETGTCLGSTTIWLAQNFPFHVTTVEANEQYYNFASKRIEEYDFGHLSVLHDDSRNVRVLDMDGCGDRTLVFLDAHWGASCPLLDELSMIAEQGIKPCIIIHDFLVPGTQFGYDKMPDSKPFNMDLIRSHLDAIYGTDGWAYNYPTKVEGARRGWISVEPV